MKQRFQNIWELIKSTFAGFSEHKVMKLSGALAYYTVFSMGPLLIVIISLCGLILGKDAVEGKVYDVLKGFVGSETASSLQEMIRNAALGGGSFVAAVIGGIVLLVGATTMFAEIQDSVNTIWGIKPKPKRGWLKYLQNRFLSFSVIISLGFLLLVSLAATTLFEGLSGRLEVKYPDFSFGLFYIVNILVSLAISTVVFGTIFKVLPDAKIRWKDVFFGALTTAILFMIGKFGISLYIAKMNVGSTFGAAGSLVILLVWVYYSAVILYLGAEFTKSYAVKYGANIRPAEYAVLIQETVVEVATATVQQTEAKKEKENVKKVKAEEKADKEHEKKHPDGKA